MSRSETANIVVVNQAANYLTVGFCNAFTDKCAAVALITGSIHEQGEALDSAVQVTWIRKWHERAGMGKLVASLVACLQIWLLLLVRYRRHEVFFVSVPPMGYLLNLLLPHRFSMVVWDVYPDTLKITGMAESHPIYRLWSRLNKLSFRKAWRLFTIGDRMADLLTRYVPRDRIIVQPIWSIFQANDRIPKADNPFVHAHQLQDRFVVQYSGNIGLTHRVEVLIELAEMLQDEPHILFQIIGRGPREPFLRDLVEQRQLSNCTFLPFQTDEMFPYSLSAADLGIVILDDRTSQGSVPSKCYNLMSYGIPALYLAAPDSQLQVYADQFGGARCIPLQDLQAAADFIRFIAGDPTQQQAMSARALAAATHFRRDNADRFVEAYFQDEESIQPHYEKSTQG